MERLEQATLDNSDNLFVDESNLAQLRRMLNIVGIMQARYEVVVTNPPYLNKMNKVLKDYVKKHYKAYSGDLFSVFIWLNINMTVKNGYAAYMTPMVWMFIKTFESLRTALLNKYYIANLIQMETHAFFDEAFVTIDSFVLQNAQHVENIGSYVRLTEFTGGMKVQEDRTLDAISDPNISYFYRANQANFEFLPGSILAYWVGNELMNVFKENKTISDYYEIKVGIQTGDNPTFYREWSEIGPFRKKWVKTNKNGEFRKWYGNLTSQY